MNLQSLMNDWLVNDINEFDVINEWLINEWH